MQFLSFDTMDSIYCALITGSLQLDCHNKISMDIIDVTLTLTVEI